MKRFKFRLEKVLTHRAQDRDEKKSVVQRIRSEINELENNIVLLRGRFDSVCESEGVILLAEQLFVNASFKERMKSEISSANDSILSKNEDLAVATQAYIQASQELRAVELLRERKLQQFNQGVEKADSASLDEMTTLRYGRDAHES